MSVHKDRLTGMLVVIAGSLFLVFGAVPGWAQDTPRQVQSEQKASEAQVQERAVPVLEPQLPPGTRPPRARAPQRAQRFGPGRLSWACTGDWKECWCTKGSDCDSICKGTITCPNPNVPNECTCVGDPKKGGL